MNQVGRFRAVVLLSVGALLITSFAIAAPGEHFSVLPSDLPAPNTTFPADFSPSFDNPPPGFAPQVPDGFSISQFASKLGYVRSLAVAPDGDIFIVRPH